MQRLKRLNPLRLLSVIPRLRLALRNRLRARHKNLDTIILTLPGVDARAAGIARLAAPAGDFAD